MSSRARKSSEDTPSLPSLINLFTSDREQYSPEILRILVEAREIGDNPEDEGNRLCELVEQLGVTTKNMYNSSIWFEFAVAVKMPTEKIEEDMRLAASDNAKAKIARELVRTLCGLIKTPEALVNWITEKRMEHPYTIQLEWLLWRSNFGIPLGIKAFMIQVLFQAAIATNNIKAFKQLVEKYPEPLKGFERSMDKHKQLGESETDQYNYSLRLIGHTNHTGFISVLKETRVLDKLSQTTENPISIARRFKILVMEAVKTGAFDVIDEMASCFPPKGMNQPDGWEDLNTDQEIIIVYEKTLCNFHKNIRRPSKYKTFEQLIRNMPQFIQKDVYTSVTTPLDYTWKANVVSQITFETWIEMAMTENGLSYTPSDVTVVIQFLKGEYIFSIEGLGKILRNNGWGVFDSRSTYRNLPWGGRLPTEIKNAIDNKMKRFITEREMRNRVLGTISLTTLYELPGYTDAANALHIITKLYIPATAQQISQYTNYERIPWQQKYQPVPGNGLTNAEWLTENIPWSSTEIMMHSMLSITRQPSGLTEKEKINYITATLKMLFRREYARNEIAEKTYEWLGVQADALDKKKSMPTPTDLNIFLQMYITDTEKKKILKSIVTEIDNAIKNKKNDKYESNSRYYYEQCVNDSSGAGSSTDPMVE